jgi:hypothetical protein
MEGTRRDAEKIRAMQPEHLETGEVQEVPT